MSRRKLLGLSTVALAGAVPRAACPEPEPDDYPAPPAAPDLTLYKHESKPHGHEDRPPLTPPEDLMREHGVLKRVLLVYREGIRWIEHDEQVPAHALHAAARVIRDYIERYHEYLEERYVFPRLRKAGRLRHTVSVLEVQHKRGRELTTRILAATKHSHASSHRREALVDDMAAFISMYEPHESREDTVVFPVFRKVTPAKEFRHLGEVFEAEEHRRLGQRGFTSVVHRVADIEKALDIHDLSQFTPPKSSPHREEGGRSAR
ncbi:hemerythrin domain-containing protein [Sphaerisporangium fuscum]|uniref:hemerythrin domain-containing protein n=1 Tax=Sphaerisporangium fuscum TaxID=2835868 RepID=UPI0027E243A4|nr:hemerythrin domain-containing protein [Sphaerisporangium fuscum]